MQQTLTLEERFQRWYVTPLETLATLNNGDGGIVVLVVSMLLYERYVNAKLGLKEDADLHIIKRELVIDLQNECSCALSEEQARQFWKMYRHGLLHGGMPKKKPTLMACLTHEIDVPIVFDKCNGKDAIVVEPWRFMRFVLGLWEKRPDLLDAVPKNPMLNILPTVIG